MPAGGLSNELSELRADLISTHAAEDEEGALVVPEGNESPAAEGPPEAETPTTEPEPGPPSALDPQDAAIPEVTEGAPDSPVAVPDEPVAHPAQYIPPPPSDLATPTGPEQYPLPSGHEFGFHAEHGTVSAATVDVAAMPLADFELWLFPEMGHGGYEPGQRTLARVMANLASAGYYPEPWQAQVAASLWARKTYKNTDVEMSRKILERAPAAEVQGLMPKTHSAAAEIFAAEEPESKSWNTMDKGTIVVGGITLVALALPFIIGRKK